MCHSTLQNDSPCHFIKNCKINSYRKLNLVLYLYQHPNYNGTSDELAQQLYWGNSFYIEDILAELERDTVIVGEQGHYRLAKKPKVQKCARCLLTHFEDPLIRQKILHQVQRKPVRLQ